MSPDGQSPTGKYALGPLLGAGGMAEVYQATVRGVEGFTRRVAVKRIRSELSRNERFVELLVTEARLTALLNHPNVVSVIDFDRDSEGRLFLAMELVAGCDLRKLIETGPIPFSVVAYVATEMLRGLGHAHDLRLEGKPLELVHRDVSPHNVLLSWDGAVKVSDFGIAKASTVAGPSGIMRGKPSYMSPEQAALEPLDRRADLYSVGAVMYRLVCGRVPHVGKSPAEVVSKLLHAPVVPVHELRGDVPRDLAMVIMRLLERDRERRYRTHVEAIDHLRTCVDMPSDGRGELAALLAQRFSEQDPARSAPAAAGVEPAPARNELAGPRATVPAVGSRSGRTASMGRVQPIPPDALDQTRTLPPRAVPTPESPQRQVVIPDVAELPMGTIGVAGTAGRPGTILSTGAKVAAQGHAIPVADRALRVGSIEVADPAQPQVDGATLTEPGPPKAHGVVSGVLDSTRSSGSVRSIYVDEPADGSAASPRPRAAGGGERATAMVTVPATAWVQPSDSVTGAHGRGHLWPIAMGLVCLVGVAVALALLS